MKPYLLLFLLSPLYVVGQLQEIITISHPDIELSNVDESGNVYVVAGTGVITKYNKSGDSLLSFSPRKNAMPTVLETVSSLRPFVYYQDFQEFAFLDQFLTTETFFGFYPDVVGFAERVTMSSDNNIWLLDSDDFSLKKYDVQANTLISQTLLDLTMDAGDYNVVQLREYQNIVFILDETAGLLLFDSFGNLQQKYAINADHIDFYEENILFEQDGYLVHFNFYKGNRSAIRLPVISRETDYGRVFRRDNWIFLISEEEITIYKLTKK